MAQLRWLNEGFQEGGAVRCLQLPHNVWYAEVRISRPKILYSFGREEELDRAAIERLIGSLSPVLDPAGAGAVTGTMTWRLPTPARSAAPTCWMRCGRDRAQVSQPPGCDGTTRAFGSPWAIWVKYPAWSAQGTVGLPRTGDGSP